ncbi:Aspartate--tRNA(Asp/Asn) ligase [Nymphon striatum]|nr:Aspartate--tRNA(Asp/Asn) ligase [Nymphon striatum]
MVSGFDKYFQIAPCFRDEDPRADRSPTDFYQLDLEMSFVTQQDVFDTIQPVIGGIFEEFGGGRKVDETWEQISYKDAALWYGSDKPDLRNPIKMQVVSEHFAGSGFAIFAKLLEQEGTEIRAIPAPKGGSRKFCDRMNAFAQKEGLPGMGYIFWREKTADSVAQELGIKVKEAQAKLKSGEVEGGMEAAGPLAKNIGPERTEAIRLQLGLNVGDAAFFLGGKPKATGLPLHGSWIFRSTKRTKKPARFDFEHNPFSMPQGGMEALQGDPLKVLGYQYDLACNGYELVSGAIRNHKPEIMFKAFEIAGYGKEEVEKRFGGMVNAFQYGAPPHGGCAAGIDRIVMLLANENNIREVILFPMNQRAEDLMMNAPSDPTSDQLMDLGLRVIPQE